MNDQLTRNKTGSGKTRATLVSLALAVVAAGGCGTSSTRNLTPPPQPPADPRQAVITAADATNGINTARYHFAVQLRTDLQQPQHLGLDGVFDFRDPHGDGHVAIARNDATYNFDVRLVHGTLYLASPLLASRLHGAKWASVDRDSLQRAGLYRDPQRSLDVLWAFHGADQVRDGGLTVIDGATVRIYRMRIDLAAAQATLGPERAARLQRAFHITGPGTRVTGAAWIDRANHVRKFQLDGSANGDAINIHYEGVINNVDQPVATPATPPPTQTRSVSPDDLRGLTPSQ